jgi:mono/diheme cytochrome c family protein
LRLPAKLVVAALALGTLAVLAVACNRTPPRKSDAELGLNPQQARGRRVYDQNCLVCHEAYASSDRNGPSLMGLYKKKFMVSGQPVNDERVRDITVMGKSKMPAYGNVLGDEQITDLIAYMKTL